MRKGDSQISDKGCSAIDGLFLFRCNKLHLPANEAYDLQTRLGTNFPPEAVAAEETR